MSANISCSAWWPQQILFGWLHVCLTAPVIYLFVGLPLLLRQHGLDGTQMGLLQLAGLPAMLKFFLGLPVDRWRFARHNYRTWATALSVAYAGALLWLALHPLGDSLSWPLLTLLMLISLLATWVDVPVNALAIALFPESQRIRAGAVRSAAMSFGAIVGGGLMLMLHTRHGWAAPLVLLAAGTVSCAVLLPWVGEPQHAAATQATRVHLSQILHWFAPLKHRFWAVLLLLYYPLLGVVWIYLKPLLLDAGIEASRIAFLVGVVGGLIAACASLAASRISRRMHNPHRALPLFALCEMLATATLWLAVGLNLGHNALLAAAALVACMIGASAGLIFALMMHYTRAGLTALDYGIQASLFVLGRSVIPLLAGVLLDGGGYSVMLGCVTLALAGIWLLVWRIPSLYYR